MTQKRAGNVINSIAVWVVRLTGAGIFLFLSWYALRYTQYMDPAVGEFPVNIRDSMGQNLFCVIVVLLIYAGFRMAGRRLSNRPKFLLWSSISLLTMVTLWMCIAGHWWISAIVRPPEGDQLYAYVAALSFAEGNYSSILPDGYCGIYPHQLGFTAILELFFKITGTTEFYQWQKLNVLCLGGIVILGYLTVRELGGKWAEQILYCLLMAACFPLIFYTSWVYGELLSIICSLAVGWMLLCYGNRRKKGWLISILPVAVMGMLVRKNFLILLLALALVLVVWGVVQRDRWACLFAGLAVILPLLSYQGIYKMYEVRSGYERSAGLPVTSWISMVFKRIRADMAGIMITRWHCIRKWDRMPALWRYRRGKISVKDYILLRDPRGIPGTFSGKKYYHSGMNRCISPCFLPRISGRSTDRIRTALRGRSRWEENFFIRYFLSVTRCNFYCILECFSISASQ